MKILIIEHHPLVRKGLQFILSQENDINVVGDTDNSVEAKQLLERYHPNIVLLGLEYKNESDLDLIAHAKQNNSVCKFIILTSSGNEYEFKRAEEIGAYGYLSKEAIPEEILYAIRLVNKGRKYYDADMMRCFINSSFQSRQAEELTPREYEVLIALGEGLCNKDIARKLFITECTVKKHVSQILSKLVLTDRTQAALYIHSKNMLRTS